MSNETDLDWLARNVHVWLEGANYVCVNHTDGGHVFHEHNRNCAIWFTKDQWLARRAELQNKPSWSKAEEWAGWLAQDSYGCWGFFQKKPLMHALSWIARSGYYQIHSPGNSLLGDWRDTLEKRPEEFKPSIEEANRLVQEFKLFTSIEDNQEQEMKQDNGWFERGELPPVGCECEILGAFGHYQEWFPCKIIAEHSGSVFAANERAWINVKHGERKFRPIRTEREVAIEEMQSDIAERWSNCEELAKYLVEKGWVKAGK